MNKQALMLLSGLALVAGFFFFSRRASAATSAPASGFGAAGGGGGATGATGALTSAPAPYSDGHFAPIPFEGSAALPGATGPKGGSTPIVTVPPVTAAPAAPAPAAGAPAALPIRVSGGGQPRKGDPIRSLV